MKAIFNNQTIAESDNTIVIEGYHYFPLESINQEYLKPSDVESKCPWKGMASYYSLEVDGKTNENSAWYYKEPSEAAKEIKGYVAFGEGVELY